MSIGEHDNNREFMQKLSENHVNVLDYKDMVIEVKDTKLHLYGISNIYYSSTFDLSNEFTLDTESYNILLAHIANFEKFKEFGIDLSLCGDTHGGIIRIPWIGAIYDIDEIFPDLQGKFVKGLYKKEDANLFVSSGLRKLSSSNSYV